METKNIKYDKLRFWILFALLNCLLFLPKYLIESGTSTFIPYTVFLTGTFFDCFKWLFVRYNYDIFRISVDLFLIVFIYYLFRRHINHKKYAWFSGIYYIISLLFIIYYNVYEKIFLIKPVLYDDFYLFKLGFINTGGSISILLVAEILGFIGIVWLIVKLFLFFLTLTKEMQFGIKSKIFLSIIGLLYLINTLKSEFTFEPHHTFQFTFAMMVDNVQYSIEAYNNLHKFDIKKLNQRMNYDHYQMKKKPNVYFIFVESYGRILYQNQKLYPNYKNLIIDCQNKLSENGFHSFSTFSTSPVSGGGSWISYSSVMFGINLQNQATYLSLMKNAESENYSHMFRWFKKKGYKNYRLVSMPDNENIRIPWELYTRFYAADEWIRFKDLKYQGTQYGFGPSPPDQYSISYANEYIINKEVSPYTLFFISQNTHNPFYSPDSVVSDWKMLNKSNNKITQPSVFLKKPKLEDYSKAIAYDMKTFVQFIIDNGKANDIFILIGDHQPPILTEKKDGFDTPMHIIVKDSLFCSGFNKYGFTKGLLISKNSKAIRHEGIYSMFMREFIRNYGIDTSNLPIYRPKGFKTDDYE